MPGLERLIIASGIYLICNLPAPLPVGLHEHELDV